MDNDQTTFLKGVVVLAKDWEWAACTLVASWLLSCCSECGTPVWVDKRLIFESAEEPNEGMPGTDPQEGADQRFEKLCVKVLHEFHEAMTMNSAAGWPFHLPQGKDDDTTVSVAEWKKVRE